VLAALVLAVALATGPSSATYRIVPVAARADGVVLCRTWRELDPTGAHAPQRVETGWLVVSGRGLWREAPDAIIDPADLGEEAAAGRIDELRRELAAPFDPARPPSTVRSLLAELGPGSFVPVGASEGAGGATWSPARTCTPGRCTGALPQRTIGGLESDPGVGTSTRATFHREGVALFHGGVDGEGVARGARFTLAPNVREDRDVGLADLGYDLVGIDGIVLLGARPPARRLPVRTRAGAAIADAPSPARARALLGAHLDAGDLRLSRGGREGRPATCAGFLRLLARGFEPATTLDIDAAGTLLARCAGLDLLSRMRPSRESHVAEPVFGPAPLAVLPPCLGGMHASREAHDAARRASAERVSWARFDPAALAATETPAAVAILDGDAETGIEALAWGDLDGDGREDVIVTSRVHARHGTWTRTGVYVLSRRAGAPLYRVVAERSLFGSGTCVAP
jgi:hypothetical protein